MQTIDLAQLVHVTGGAGCPTQAPEQADAPDAGSAPQGGGGFIAGLEQFLGFFQSQGFQQVIGGLRQLLAGQSAPSEPGSAE